MELPTLEQDLANIKAAAAQRRAEAAIPQVEHVGGTGGPGIGSMLESGADAFAESPIGKAAMGLKAAVDGTGRWIKNLPKNLSLGALDAAVNSVGAAFDLAEASVFPVSHPEVFKAARAPVEGPYNEWRASLREDDSMSDALTQGVAQFTVPFMAWARATGVSSKLGLGANFVRGMAAEAATTGTAFGPQDGRIADLVDLGRHSEGRLGDVLRQVTPDGSAANAYINYMVDRTGDSNVEARFKNIIDNAVPSVALAGFLKAGAATFKMARNLPAEMAKNPVMPGSRRSQRGQLTLSLDSQPREVPLGNVTDSHTDSVLDGEFVVPGSQVLTSSVDGKPAGFIAFKEEGGTLQINRVKVADELRGKGIGKQLLLQALDQAEAQGKKLVSDNTVTVAQLRVYESLSKNGQIRITYSDPEAVKAALAAKDSRVPVKGKGGQPVVTSIERIQPIKE